MVGQLHYFITALPSLGALGTAPPIGLAELLEHLSEVPRARRLVETIVLLDDLEQREAFLAGELKQVEPAVLSIEQAKGEAPLPDFLAPAREEEESFTIELDRLWANYFRFVHQTGLREGSDFLRRWVGFEVAFRNALAVARARKLGLEEAGYVVVPELGDTDFDFSTAIGEWETAKTPLAGLQVIIRTRWEWCDRNDAWFQFVADELLVYAFRIMLLSQWRRTSGEEKSVQSSE